MDVGPSTALIGAGIFSIHSHYQNNAGPLSEVRKASADNMQVKQKVMDADILTGGLVLLTGGSLAYLTQSSTPLILAILGFALISGYYHAALNGPTLPYSATTIEMESSSHDHY